MQLRRSEALALVGALLGPVAGVVALVAGTRAGLVVLGVAVGLLGAGLTLMVRHVLGALARVEQGQRRLARRTDRSVTVSRRALRKARLGIRLTRRATRVVDQVVDTTKQVTATQAQGLALLGEGRRATDRIESRLQTDHHRFRTSLDTLPSDVLRLQRFSDLLAPDATGLPGLGDWAVTTGTLLAMLDEVYSRPGPVTIVECGSGSSTLFLALALRDRGLGGRVVALESDAAFAEETREHLRRHGVDDLATVVDAPLADRDLPGRPTRPWFDISGLPDLASIDLLFVDGPVGGSTFEARYPAYPVLGNLLTPGALVVLDDTDRPHETAIIAQWLDLSVAGRTLSVERTNVRTTFFRVAAQL